MSGKIIIIRILKVHTIAVGAICSNNIAMLEEKYSRNIDNDIRQTQKLLNDSDETQQSESWSQLQLSISTLRDGLTKIKQWFPVRDAN